MPDVSLDLSQWSAQMDAARLDERMTILDRCNAESNDRLGAEPEWLFGVSPCGCVTAALADVRCAALVEDFEEKMERSGRKAEYMPKSIGMGALKKTCTHARA